MDIIYKVVFCLFVVIGAASSMDAVVKFSDAMVFAMVLPNMIGLFFLAPVVTGEVKRFVESIKGK